MDTSAARAAIFRRIRQAQNRPEQATDAELAQVRQYLADHGPGPRPDLGLSGLSPWAFPSGHVLRATVVYGFPAVWLARPLGPAWRGLP